VFEQCREVWELYKWQFYAKLRLNKMFEKHPALHWKSKSEVMRGKCRTRYRRPDWLTVIGSKKHDLTRSWDE